MNVYLYTSVYIDKIEVERRLGTLLEVLAGDTVLMYSQITLVSTCVHPDDRSDRKERSP
jgi:hypothetical protein